MRDPAFVLFRFPIEFIRANGLKFVELGPKDSEVEVVTEIAPRDNEECEIRADKWVIEVVEGFGCL